MRWPAVWTGIGPLPGGVIGVIAQGLSGLLDGLVVAGKVGGGYRCADTVAQRLGGPEEAGGQSGVAFGRFDACELFEALGDGAPLAESFSQPKAAPVKGPGWGVVLARLGDQAQVGQRDRLEPPVAGLLGQLQRLEMQQMGAVEIADVDSDHAEE
jgi:hypothetical protein